MEFTKAERELFARMGRKGGKNRIAQLSPKERTKLARKAIKARWDKARAAAAQIEAKRSKRKAQAAAAKAEA